MSTEENNQHKPDITEFIKSLQTETPQPADTSSEDFPFADTFDIDAFASENNNPLERTLTSVTQRLSRTPVPTEPPAAKTEGEPLASAQQSNDGEDNDAFNIDLQGEEKDQSIKHLEQKIAELQSRFEDANKEKTVTNYFQEELENDKEITKYTPNVKANDEFFQNISTTIENLKGSLENIVSSRLQYEENLIRQDQNLVNRLREKTGRLKAINLALNSEVKRAKNEKLESLRRSAEQTKELLSVRMQLSKVEEKARHGDFKLSRLEQQLASITEEKIALEDEMRRVREEKLESLRRSAEQTKEIMSLRLELSKTEEKFKQEEIQAGYVQDQLKQLEAQRAALDNEIYSTRSQRQEADRKAAELERRIEDLNFQVTRSQEGLKQEAQTVSSLREKLLSSETELQRLNNEKAALMLKVDDNLKQLEAVKAQHDKEIENLKAAQLQEIEVLKNQKSQEAQSVTLELRRAEDKYRQEETFVKTLQVQRETLQQDIKKLESEKQELKGKSTDIARGIDFIRDGYKREIENLTNELTIAKEKFEREESSYRNLSEQYFKIEQENKSLNEEAKKIIASRDEALEHNNRYREEIEQIKAEHENILNSLKADLAQMQEKHARELEEFNALKEQEMAALKDNFNREISTASDNFNREKETLTEQFNQERAAADREKESLKEQFNQERAAADREKESLKEQFNQERAAADREKESLKESFKQEMAIAAENFNKEKEGLHAQLQDLKNVTDAQKQEITLQFESFKGSSAKEREDFLAQIAALKDSSAKETAAHLEQIRQLTAARDEAIEFNNLYREEIAHLKTDTENTVNALKADLTGLQQRYDGDIANVAAAKDKEIAQAKEDFEKQSAALAEAFNKEKYALKTELEELTNISEAQKQEITLQFESFKESSTKEREDFLAQISALKDSSAKETAEHLEQIRQLTAARDEAVEYNNLYREQIESLRTNNENIVNTLKADMSQMQEKYSGEIANITAAKAQEIAAAKDSFDKQTAALVESFNKEKYALKAELEEFKNITEAQKQEITLQFETFKGSSSKEREDFLAQISALKDSSAKETAAHLAEIQQLTAARAAAVEELQNLKEKSAKDTQELTTRVEELKKASSLQQELHNAELLKMHSALQENESVIATLSQQIESFSQDKGVIEEELKKIASERYQILQSLEQKSQELENYHKRYELEILAVKEEKDKEVALYQAKLESVSQRLMDEEKTVSELKEKISSLEQEKASFASSIDGIRQRTEENVKRVVSQTEEILSLKTQLAKAEGKFLHDSVLISQLKEQFNDREVKVTILSSQIKELRTENVELRKDILSRQEELSSLKEILAQTEDQLKKEQFTVQNLQEHTAKLKAVNFALDRQVKQAQEERLEALHKSAEQAQEILVLRDQLEKAGTGIQTLDFSEGLVSVRKEYEAKVEKLETELKDASALCASQVREIQDLKTDNARLKHAEEEKLQIEVRFESLNAKLKAMQSELANYQNKDADTTAFTLAKAKAAALNAQITKVNREKEELKDQLVIMQQTIEDLNAREKQSMEAFAALKQKINENDTVIEKLKKDIIVLTSENRDLKASAQMNTVRQQVLEAKIDQVETENRKLSTISGVGTSAVTAAERTATIKQGVNTNKAMRTVNAVAPVAKPQAGQNPAQTNPGLTKTNSGLAKTNPAAINPAAKTQTATVKTKPGLTKQQGENALEKSILDFPETKDAIEVVDVESDEMDLSMIFDEKDLHAEDTKTGRTSHNTASMQTLKTNTIKPMTLKTGPIPSEKTTRSQIPDAQQDQGPYDEMEFTDHSAAKFHGVTRRPIGRVPNYRESEAYSDFLKRTKSIFFRIKWSLFKE